MKTARRLLAATLLISFAPLHAQTGAHRAAPTRRRPAAAVGTVPAIFLSDIHLDPYSDPAKVRALIAAPVSEWGAILGSPDSPTRAKDYADLAAACPTRGADTDDRLWQSALGALRANSRGVRFATLTGDLLAHSFDCKYKKLAEKPNAQEYLAFTSKTAQYIVNGLRGALPDVPVYITLGNNDTGCVDYHLDPSGDAFLKAVAPLLAESLPASLSSEERTAIAADVAEGGHYTALLPAPFVRTRVIAMDDIYFSVHYATCGAEANSAKAAAAQMDWLNAQLSKARAHHERVWFLGHIPPGVDLYASARKLLISCSASSAEMFLASDSMATALAENTDIVPLALFGHTHSDEIRLLTPADLVPAGAALTHAQTAGVPAKVVPSITPINGNLPAFIVAQVRPATATLVDYTVVMASGSSGVGTEWKPSYSYSERYHKHAFDSAEVSALINELHADHSLSTPASQAYVSSYTEGVPTPLLQLAWTPYTCALSHTTRKSFAACACGQ